MARKKIGSQLHRRKSTLPFIFEDIKRVIDALEERGIQIAGVVTDNTNTNKAVWRMLEDEYPDKFFYGCVCHALHLLVRDILDI